MKPLLAAAVMVSAAMTFAQDPATESAARTALARGEYAKVLQVYQPLTSSGTPLSDVAHYRLAIAARRVGKSAVAWQHLSKALTLNPQGSFTTSPAKLADLRTAILAACASEGRAQCNPGPGPTPASAPQAVAAISPETAGGAQVPALASPATAASAALPLAAAAAQTSAVPVAAPACGQASDPTLPQGESQAQKNSPSATKGLSIAVGVLVGVLGCLVGWQVRSYERRRAAGTDVLEALRDSVALLLHRLSLTGGEDTVLYRQLVPLLEHEVGRTAYRAGGHMGKLVETDRKAVEWARHLSRAPLDVLTSSAHDIQLLFQRRAI